MINNWGMDRFDSLQLFARIVELGSFTRAAGALGIPRATATHALKELEARLGTMHEAMASPEFYRQDGEQIAAAKAQLESLERELASCFERWEALEAQRAEAS